LRYTTNAVQTVDKKQVYVKQACTIKSRPHVTATELRLERSLLALQNYKSNKCVTNNASQPKA